MTRTREVSTSTASATAGRCGAITARTQTRWFSRTTISVRKTGASASAGASLTDTTEPSPCASSSDTATRTTWCTYHLRAVSRVGQTLVCPSHKWGRTDLWSLRNKYDNAAQRRGRPVCLHRLVCASWDRGRHAGLPLHGCYFIYSKTISLSHS